MLHEHAGVRVLADFGGKEVEEIPLRHKSDEGRVHGQMGEVRDVERLAAEDGAGLIGFC